MLSLDGRGWTSLRLATRRRLRYRPTSVKVGRRDQFLDKDSSGSRSYGVYTPTGLRPGTAVPLVVVLDGCNQSAKDAVFGTEVNAYADRAGFVVVYPEQSVQDNPGRCWNWFQPRHQARGLGAGGDRADNRGSPQRARRGDTGPQPGARRGSASWWCDGWDPRRQVPGRLPLGRDPLSPAVRRRAQPHDGAPGDEEWWAGS